MTSEIQWDEDWFSVCDVPISDIQTEAETANETAGLEDSTESIESIKEWIEKDIRKQERDPSHHHVNQRMDRLEQLIHRQNEIIRGLGDEIGTLTGITHVLTSEIQTLKGEVDMLKGELHSTSRTSMTHLLEELKRVKERELNYALRRHQPIPFFDSGNLMRLVGSVHSMGASIPTGSMGSPLFRLTGQKSQLPSLHL